MHVCNLNVVETNNIAEFDITNFVITSASYCLERSDFFYVLNILKGCFTLLSHALRSTLWLFEGLIGFLSSFLNLYFHLLAILAYPALLCCRALEIFV